ncbi:MAG: leucyl/phenylalanyl-tRNA--protein transferase [Ilumatobacteraceae bacterium]
MMDEGMSRRGAEDLAPVEPEPSRWVLPSEGPTDDSALVAIGGDLEPGTLLAAYRMGLFPMPVPRRRIGWFSPDPRGILPLDQLVISRSLRRSLKRYTVSRNEAFTEVVTNCADPRRPSGWIDRSIIDAYTTLHQLGWAHSIEVWDDDRLVGGLYGVRIHGFFAGESMFHHATDASKVALVHLVDWFHNSHGKLLDVQWTTDHLIRLGAVDIARHDYLQLLKDAVLPFSRKNDPAESQ